MKGFEFYMSRSAETKTYGSIRKVKHYGACGVILGLAALGTALSSGTVSADEVTNNATNAKQVQSASTPNSEVSQSKSNTTKGSVEVTVNHEKLDKAVYDAKSLGLDVVVGEPTDAGVVKDSKELESKQQEIEKSYEDKAKQLTDDAKSYKKEVDTRNQEITTIKTENAEAKKVYEDNLAKYRTDLATAVSKNKQIEKENKEKHAKHLSDVAKIIADNEQIKKDNALAKSNYAKALESQKTKNDQIDKENAAARKKYESELGKWTERKVYSEAEFTEYNKKMAQYHSDLATATAKNAEIDRKNKANKDAYDKAVIARNKENEAIRKENATAKANYEKALAALNARNAQIDKENAKLKSDFDNAVIRYEKAKENYESDLVKFNKKVEEIKKQPVLAQGNGVTLYGTFDESKRGSMDYFGKITAVFEKDPTLETVDGALSATPKTKLELVKGLTLDPRASEHGNVAKYGGGIITGIKEGSKFRLTNIGRTTSGKTISAELTSRTTPSKVYNIPNNKDVYTRLWVWWYKDRDSSPVGFNPYNYANNEWDIRYYDENTGKPLNLGTTTVYADLDYIQAVRHTYGDTSELGAFVNPPGSKVARSTYNGKPVWMGIHSDGVHDTDDDSGLNRWKAGDPWYVDVNDYFDTPRGTVLTAGKGTVHHLTYLHDGLNGSRGYTEAESLRYRVTQDAKDKAAGRPIKSDFDLYSGGYAFQLWGGKSVIAKLVPPEDPEPPMPLTYIQKEKDTLEKPTPKPEKPSVEPPVEEGHVPNPVEPPKPSEFTERKPLEPEYEVKDKTLITPPTDKPLKGLPNEKPDVPKVPLPVEPPKPEEKPVPNPIPRRTVTINYTTLRMSPVVEKFVKNNRNENVHNSSVPKLSEVIWELETKPLPRNREVTEVYEIHDDLPQGYRLNLAKTQVQNSDYTISYDESTHRLTGILKAAGIAKANANLVTEYKVPVLKVYGEVTNDNAVYKNNFHLNLNNKFEAYSNIVGVTTPGGTKPVKVNYNKDGVKIDGKQVLAGSVNYYHVTMDYSKYKGIKSGSDAIQKGFGVVEDYPEETLDIERGEIRAFDSNGAEVKGITEYHFNSIEEVKDPKIKAVLEISGIKPKGAFQVFMADNPQEFFDKYVSKGISVTIVDPMRVKQALDRKGVSYQNTAYQVDFGNGYQADIVENRVPKTNPHKKNLNAKGVNINGKQVLAESTNYYTLTAD